MRGNLIAILVLTLAADLFGNGCASQKAESARQGANAEAPSTNTSLEGDCTTAGISHVLNKYQLAYGGKTQSLCQVLNASPSSVKSLTIMITTPTCESCKPTLTTLHTAITESDHHSKLIVAVPRANDAQKNAAVGTYTDQDIRNLVNSYAPTAMPAFDDNAHLWFDYAENKQLPMVPIIIILNRQGTGTSLQTSQLESNNAVSRLVMPAIEKYSI